MNHTCTLAWGFLTRLIRDQKWLTEAYGSENHAQAAVSSYYQLLTSLNLSCPPMGGSNRKICHGLSRCH